MDREDLFHCKTGYASVPDNVIHNLLGSAEADICLYLNRRTLEDRFDGSVAELAVLRYKKGQLNSGVKSRSYSEKDVSETVNYQTEIDFQAQEEALFQKLNRFRLVAPHV